MKISALTANTLILLLSALVFAPTAAADPACSGGIVISLNPNGICYGDDGEEPGENGEAGCEDAIVVAMAACFGGDGAPGADGVLPGSDGDDGGEGGAGCINSRVVTVFDNCIAGDGGDGGNGADGGLTPAM